MREQPAPAGPGAAGSSDTAHAQTELWENTQHEREVVSGSKTLTYQVEWAGPVLKMHTGKRWSAARLRAYLV